MAHRSTLIDGLAIQSEYIRDLRLHQYQFSPVEIFAFVPEPGRRGAPEAFVSARYKQRVFALAGFRCTICRIGEESADRGLYAIENGNAFFIVQRPLELSSVFKEHTFEELNLETRSIDSLGMSALTDTVIRITKPFIERRQLARPSKPVRVGVIGDKGFCGSEIRRKFLVDGVELYGVDLGDEISQISNTDIVISAVGRPGIISGDQLGVQKDLLVDVGYSYNEEQGRGYGDFSPSCYASCKFYTPVPGGVGPLQALTLVERAVALTGFGSYRPWILPDLGMGWH
jgi:hypothetical protein